MSPPSGLKPFLPPIARKLKFTSVRQLLFFVNGSSFGYVLSSLGHSVFLLFLVYLPFYTAFIACAFSRIFVDTPHAYLSVC